MAIFRAECGVIKCFFGPVKPFSVSIYQKGSRENMKRNSAIILIAVLGLLFLPTACGYKSIKHGTAITQEQSDKIQDGVSTKNDIILEFGNPTKTLYNSTAWFYSWTRGGQGHFLGFSQDTVYTYSLVVIFDENGVVKNHKITRGDTDQATGISDESILLHVPD